MSTFDQILANVAEVLLTHAAKLPSIGPMVINRDLNGRVRLIVREAVRENDLASQALVEIATDLVAALGPHAFPVERAVLYEDVLEAVSHNATQFKLDGFEDVTVVDRLATEGDWTKIEPESEKAPRGVFFSIKGGVGRSTALAASAWALAQAGKRVLVLDLDLESPGLSSALLPEERRPTFGIVDWLVEDLVDNGNVVFEDMVATSSLSHDGEIYVVPAHGRDPGEYVAKLGRVWMSKAVENSGPEKWSRRLARLIDALEERWRPDIIFIDSRAGIDEVASSCVTDLGANLVLLFAIDGEQTWSGYRMLFAHWRQHDVARDVRQRLQLVGAQIPDDERRLEYFDGLRERSYDLFLEELYDEIPPGDIGTDRWTFDVDEVSAPHYPWAIAWNRGFAALRSIHDRFASVDAEQVKMIFGPLTQGLLGLCAEERGK